MGVHVGMMILVGCLVFFGVFVGSNVGYGVLDDIAS